MIKNGFRATQALLVILVVLQMNIIGQTEPLLDTKVAEEFSRSNLQYVLNVLAVKYRIPIGLEMTKDETFKTEINTTVEDGTLKELLISMFEQEPNYKWELRDGVINITPVKYRSDFLETFLDTPVTRFDPAKAADKFEIRDEIFVLPEVKNLLRANNIDAKREYYISKRSIYSDENVDLGASNTNVRGILNKIVRVSEHKIWTIAMSGKQHNKLVISF